VVVNSMVDRPWSQDFCGLVLANRAFVRRHPVATKRAVRAILKAADRCSLEPERAARFEKLAVNYLVMVKLTII
jgi:NitT/TauT family transport system substrate-binding protein